MSAYGTSIPFGTIVQNFDRTFNLRDCLKATVIGQERVCEA